MGKELAPAEPRPHPEGIADERVSLRCTYCHDALGRKGAVFCAACLAPHHADCRRAHGACAGPGCTETRTLAPRRRSLGFALGAAALLVAGAALWAPPESPPDTAPPVLKSIAPPAPEPVPIAEPVQAPIAPPAPEPVAAPEPVEAPEPPQEPRLYTKIEFAVGDFAYPVTLGAGQRLTVNVDDEGYTEVYLCPPPASDSWVYGKSILVAEPGKTVELRCPTGVWPLAPTRRCSLEVLASEHQPPRILINARPRAR